LDPNQNIGSDIAIIPIELELTFFAKIRPGMQFKYGWTQDVKTEFDSLKLEVKECQYVFKEFVVSNRGKNIDIDPDREHGLTQLQVSICSQILDYNAVVGDLFHDEIEKRLRFQTDEGIAGFLGTLNEWYPFPEH
jgi:hypothetical protein